MDYELCVPAGKDYVYVQPKKDISSTRLPHQFARHAIELGNTHEICKALIDYRLVTSYSGAFDKYFFAYEHSTKMGLTRHWRAALVRRPENTELDFLETVMQNAGFSFRIFTDMDAARDWLAADSG
ncbi:hypothetical protein FKG94_06660 [Exilibacterium tricleocarpae]|uniref:STAS/SEC14 domain-containing protein n=1 Tax=Exilibacterium tricleocarpae TaxID=2591008 RepID=A0A545TYY6_9GAMM|nr:hypothetical protein [Exilibacterium tricleocarpae]TQV82421.1 hypothetical protein FKG94_06660 [Exilibacterium tricleocarpae]